MDKQIRKFMQYKISNLQNLKRELRLREKMRDDIIDSSPLPPDGTPRGKGGTSNPTETKVIRLDKLNLRISKLKYEIKTIEEVRDSLDKYHREIFDETLAKRTNLSAKSDLLEIPYKRLIDERGMIVREIASRLGEYVEDFDE